MDRSARCVTLDNQQHAVRNAAELVEVTLLSQANRPEILIPAIRFHGPNDLQAMNTAGNIEHRDSHCARWRVANAKTLNALPHQVGRLTGRQAFTPCNLGFFGCSLVPALRFGLGPLLVLGDPGLERGHLLGSHGLLVVLLEFDLLHHVFGAKEGPEATDDQQAGTIRLRNLVKLKPAPLFPLADHDVARLDVKPESLHLAQHIIEIDPPHFQPPLFTMLNTHPQPRKRGSHYPCALMSGRTHNPVQGCSSR